MINSITQINNISSGEPIIGSVLYVTPSIDLEQSVAADLQISDPQEPPRESITEP